MPASRNVESWQQVDSRADFAAYLRLLALDCERACGGQGSEVPAAAVDPPERRRLPPGPGPPAGRPCRRHRPAARRGPRPARLERTRLPTRRGPHDPPGADGAFAGSGTGCEEGDTARDLRRYAAALATDFTRAQREHGAGADDGGNRAHSTLYDWLGAWAAWAGAGSPLHEQLGPVTWRSVALQLSAAKIYE